MNVLKSASDFFKDILIKRNLVFELALKDFKLKYLGSYLGILWAFVHPTILILIYWFIFQVGFKTTPVDDFPFVLWLISGIIPWFFFSESLMAATNSIIEYSYLVKKVVFRVSLLPIIKLISSLFIHVFFIIITIFIFFFYGFKPNIYNLQIVYYLFSMIVFLLAISYITSSLNIFLKDIGQLIAMMLQFGFWLTPIFWSFDIVPDKYRKLLELNPLYYIVEGYRNSFIYNKWFWEDRTLTIYFWTITFILLVIGGIIFKKLRPHFSDVL